MPEPRWPLRAWVCADCWLLQLDDTGPDEDTGEHAAPAWSDTMERHARGFAVEVVSRSRGPEGRDGRPPTIVEMASHGGYLQESFRELATPTVIIERSRDRAQAAQGRGLSVETASLDESTAIAIREGNGPADAVVDFYLLAHLREPAHLLRGIKALLRTGAVAAVEFDHVLPIITEHQFDALRHGHFSYLSLTALMPALERAGLRAVDAEPQPVFGGAIRLWLETGGRGGAVSAGLRAELEAERAAGLDRLATFRTYGSTVAATAAALRTFLESARAEGRTVAGYGAPSRANTLLNTSGVTTSLLPFTVDRSPAKQGRFLSGSHIPILSPDHLVETRPDFVLILTWDLAAEVQAQLPRVRDWGGRFVVPIPELTILP